MNVQYIIPSYNISAMLAEDTGTPELRNPNSYVEHTGGEIVRFLKKVLSRIMA